MNTNAKAVVHGLPKIRPLLRIDLPVFALCVFISLLYLLLCSKSSPLYPFNDWVDVNAFFTMGKGMMHGLVPYRDLFEQKGPLLYFIYGITSLISYKTFLGGFIFEVIGFPLFLFFSYKSMLLFMEKKAAIISLPFLPIMILNLKAFTHGGSAEELCLPLLAVSLFHLLRLFKTTEPAATAPSVFLVNGFIAGCVLWIKFSMLGFWLGWILAFFINLIGEKQPGRAVKGAANFMGGMVLATLPWIAYFGYHHAIPDWINTYFVVNLTSYPTGASLIERLWSIFLVLLTHFSFNPIFGSLLWFGVISFSAFSKFVGRLLHRLLLLICFLLLILGVFWGGTGYVYYYLILSPFVILGFIVLQDAFKKFLKKPISDKLSIALVGVTLLISLPLILLFNQNAYLMKVNKDDLVQYRFAEIINQNQDTTLLNYGFLDMGFYTTTGTLPTVKYFELQNLAYSRFPKNLDEQQMYIKKGQTKFVVLPQYAGTGNPTFDFQLLEENYRLVSSQKQVYEGKDIIYFLFERRW